MRARVRARVRAGARVRARVKARVRARVRVRSCHQDRCEEHMHEEGARCPRVTHAEQCEAPHGDDLEMTWR